MIYFDNAATSYPKPEEVYNALDYANRHLAFNAGRGEYKQSTDICNLIDRTRIGLTELIGAPNSKVIFTPSATDTLNIIINGLNIKEGDHVYVSPFEHNAVVRTLYNLNKKINFTIHVLKFNKEDWEPEYDVINDEFILFPPKAVFLSHISNVTGYIIPYNEIFSMSAKWNCINVLDCAQSLGVVKPVGIENVNYIVFAGHKSLYASFGIAGFFKLKDDFLEVTKAGGTGSDSLNLEMPSLLPSRFEPGSINSVAIAGLNASVQWLKNTDVYNHEKTVYSYLIKRLGELPNIIIYQPKNSQCFGVVSFNVINYTSEDVATILSDEFDICVRSGFHCAPFVHDFLDSKEYYGTVRISLSYFNKRNEVDALINALKTL